jgi:ArsR family transcriptional regulator
MNGHARKLGLFFAALSDETRLRILANLIDKSLNVNEIKQCIGHLTLPAISYQLKILQSQDIVRYTKKGREKFFQISDKHVAHILNDAIKHISGDDECSDDSSCDESYNIKEVIL